jgi:excisionase family DNA binding protein
MIQDISNSARDVSTSGISYPTLVDINALSEMLNISKGTLYNWVYLKRIPFIKAGRCLRFDPREVFDSLRHCRTMAEAGKG